jgi:DNA end-binding protein Ku
MEKRPVWEGTIGFGLVTIPVRMFPATARKSPRFHLLHDADHAPLQRKMICPADGKEVEVEHMVRGFEIAPDKYIAVRQKELDSLAPVRSRSVEILLFVDSSEIEPLSYDGAYILEPDGAEKAYVLLAKVIGEADKVGVAKFVMRDREYLVGLKNIGGVLHLLILRYANQISSRERFASEILAQPDRAVDSMVAVMKKMSGKFTPSKYHDKHRAEVLKLIKEHEKDKKKMKARVVPAEEHADPVDLLVALERSVKGKGGGVSKRK